jgi:hypothetical protein
MSQTLDQLEVSAMRPASVEPGFEEFDYKPIPPLAPVSLLLGVCALSGLLSPLGALFALFGFVLGLVAIRQIRRAEGGYSGQKIATAGVVLSTMLFVGSVSLHAYWFATEVPEGYQRVSFTTDISRKGFIIEDNQMRVHPDVAELAGKPLFVKGYMYPVGQVTGLSTFLLCRDNGDCCFGGQPKLADMIMVKLRDGLTTNHTQHMVAVAGTFRIRNRWNESTLEPAFELEATQVELAKTSY